MYLDWLISFRVHFFGVLLNNSVCSFETWLFNAYMIHVCNIACSLCPKTLHVWFFSSSCHHCGDHAAWFVSRWTVVLGSTGIIFRFSVLFKLIQIWSRSVLNLRKKGLWINMSEWNVDPVCVPIHKLICLKFCWITDIYFDKVLKLGIDLLPKTTGWWVSTCRDRFVGYLNNLFWG